MEPKALEGTTGVWFSPDLSHPDLEGVCDVHYVQSPPAPHGPEGAAAEAPRQHLVRMRM